MKKKIFTLLTLLLCAVGLNAETYSAEPLTVTWADPSSAVVGVASPSEAVAASEWTGTSCGTASYEDVKYTQINATGNFEFTFTPFPGLTFTPSKVTFDIMKFGSDNCFAEIYVVYGDEDEVQLADLSEKGDIARNKGTVGGARTKSYDLDASKVSSNAVTLRIKFKPASGKKMGVANVVISGTVTGTPAEVTKYSVAVASNNVEYGTAASTVTEVVEGNEVTLTATPLRGYGFVNWTDNNNDGAEVSTVAEYTFTPTANVNYTANFAALPEYTISAEANIAEAGTVTYTTFDDSKYFKGDEVSFEARPNLGYVFEGWSDSSTDWNHAAITLSENVALTANFAALTEPLANAVWALSENTDAVVNGVDAVLTAGSKVEILDKTTTVGGVTLRQVQPIETADGSDDFSVIFTITPTLTDGQAFVARSIEFDAVRCGTNGGNFTLKIIRDGVVSNIASNQVPEQSEVSHYYFNLDDAKEVLSTAVIKIVLGGSLSSSKQYAFANLKVNGYVRSATPVSITTTKEYTTYVTPNALDFANATPAGLKAYTVSALSITEATLTEVTQAPANTGIILKGTAGQAYTIPVIASASAVGTNYLKAAVEATEVEANAAYVLNGGQFKLVTTASSVPAGKAYLLASDISAGANTINFNFGGETTGINEELRMKNEESVYYNLAGQRVAQPTKGLYIVNGKKVIVK